MRNKSIEELNEQIAILKTQRPFVRKANVLKAVDIFSFLSLVMLPLSSYFYGRMGIYNSVFFAAVIVAVEITSLVLLGKNKFALHMVLRCLYFAAFVTWGYLYDRYDHEWAEIENFVHYIPAIVINLWSMVVSMREEIYVTN